MRVLILGGTGLVSAAITRQLLGRGETVVHFNRGQAPAADPGWKTDELARLVAERLIACGRRGWRW